MEEAIQYNGKRGKSFTVSQDIIICNSWMAITQDPVVGNLQSSNKFWDRVLDNYMKKANDQSVRSRNSIQSRWGMILRSCNKFHGYLTQIENRKQSGTTETDSVLQAKLLYVELEKKKFAFEHCWKILKQSIKWQDLITQKNRTSTMNTSDDFQHPSSPSEDLETPISLDSNNDADESKFERPIGRKAEKESRKRSKIVDTSNSRLCDLMCEFNKQTVETQQRKALAEERKLQILEEANDRERKKTEVELKLLMDKHEREQQEKDDKIMMMDTSNMDSITRAYYEHRKAQIFAKISPPTNIESDAYVPLPPSPSQSWL